MIRTILKIALAIGLGAPAVADTLPSGRYMLSTYLWPDTLVPRYALVEINGPELALEFSYSLPMNYQDCEAGGLCVFETTAAQALAEVENGALQLSDIDIHEAAPVAPETVEYIGQPAHLLYTAPLLGLMHGAEVRATATGFALHGVGAPLEFYLLKGEARDAAMMVPLMHELSIREMAGCEVTAIVPLYFDGAASAAQRAVLEGVIHQWTLRRVPRPRDVELSEEETSAYNLRMLAAQLPRLVSVRYPEPGAPFREPLWEWMGDVTFKGDRARFDETLAGYGDSLDPLVEFLRLANGREEPVTVEAACADPFLGLLE